MMMVMLADSAAAEGHSGRETRGNERFKAEESSLFFY